jgi:hypothetical protein
LQTTNRRDGATHHLIEGTRGQGDTGTWGEAKDIKSVAVPQTVNGVRHNLVEGTRGHDDIGKHVQGASWQVGTVTRGEAKIHGRHAVPPLPKKNTKKAVG